MLSYNVHVKTKLGSLRSKAVPAESEEEAIAKAKESFPLYEEVWVEGEPQAYDEAQEDKADPLDRIGEMQRDAEIEKRKNKRSEGMVWLGIGAVLTLAMLLFYREAALVCLAPVIWGGYLYKRNDTAIKKLEKNRADGIPFASTGPIGRHLRSRSKR